ncbi:MAG: aldehyde ferredoxin oxidoreductase, partial [Candidatus Bathyarchaeota archaeon]|nr:aldehyde ferredoxin oxidoreductase [Candidatus Bathyarchaeota archaeon]
MEFYGYIGKVVRINLTTGNIKVEALNPKMAYNFLGGRGYAAKILYDELKPSISPLSEENKLIFMTGPLTGTEFPGSGRISISTKSPLTGTIFDSSMGGSFGAYLKRSGYDGIILEGRAKNPTYILVDDEKVFIEDASSLWGTSTSTTEEKLRSQHGVCGVACIGPAGENFVYLANIMSEGRTAGRGGLGAVMGSKNLKAIVVKGGKKAKIFDEKAYRIFLKKIKFIIENDPFTGFDGTLSRFGTAGIVHRIRSAGILPVDDFSGKMLSFEEADKFSGETIREKFYFGRRGCYLC